MLAPPRRGLGYIWGGGAALGRYWGGSTRGVGKSDALEQTANNGSTGAPGLRHVGQQAFRNECCANSGNGPKLTEIGPTLVDIGRIQPNLAAFDRTLPNCARNRPTSFPRSTRVKIETNFGQTLPRLAKIGPNHRVGTYLQATQVRLQIRHICPGMGQAEGSLSKFGSTSTNSVHRRIRRAILGHPGRWNDNDVGASIEQRSAVIMCTFGPSGRSSNTSPTGRPRRTPQTLASNDHPQRIVRAFLQGFQRHMSSPMVHGPSVQRSGASHNCRRRSSRA